MHASRLIHLLRTCQHRPNIHPLQSRRQQPHRRKLRRPSANPVIHRKRRDPPFRLRYIVQLAALTRHRHSILSKIQTHRLKGRLRLNHAIARLRRSARLRNHQDKGAFYAIANLFKRMVNPCWIGIINKMNLNIFRRRSQRLRHKLRPQGRPTNPNRQHIRKPLPSWRLHFPATHLLRKTLNRI